MTPRLSTPPAAGARQSSVVREHVALLSAGRLLSCFVHRPAVAGSERRPGVAIFHGLMGAKGGLHQLYVKLADALARAGTVALRVDFRGRGDSEGDSVDVTPAGDLADAAVALEWLAAQSEIDGERIGLVGHSWGGTIGACLAGLDRRVAALALWGSLPGADLDWRPPMREVGGRQVAELWGNLLGAEFYAGLREVDAMGAVVAARVPLLLVYGTQDDAIPLERVAEIRAELDSAGVANETLVIPDADHALMGYDWERQAIEGTAEWLTRVLAARA